MLGNVIKIVVAAALLIAVDVVFEVNFPVVREVNIDTEKLKQGEEVTLLQVSDFHGGASAEIVQRLIKALGNIKLDAVLITGDLVDRSTEDFSNVDALVSELRSICPSIFFVSGNHEWSNNRRKELLVKLKDMGVVILNNKGSTFAARSADINICGVDDAYGRRDNIEKAMKSVNSNKYTVLLSHSPKIRQRLGHYSPDLILCGHTHGGQIRFPFIGAIIEPGEGLFPHFDKGMFKLKENSLLYIDSGVGTSKLPIRFLNRSQVSIIRIKGR
ncbi:MAG TPA: metallophosphoesterase [Clostridia bacterium]|nr:metallophosphoesterase [Clostridia bacterium]